MLISLVCILQVVLATVWSFPGHHIQKGSNYHKVMPYDFAYGVKDDYTGTHFSRNEKSDGNVVSGSYTVQLPDGRKQIVLYKADHYNGYQAEIFYEGIAHYPPPSKYQPFTVKPTYHQHGSSNYQKPPTYNLQKPPTYSVPVNKKFGEPGAP